MEFQQTRDLCRGPILSAPWDTQRSNFQGLGRQENTGLEGRGVGSWPMEDFGGAAFMGGALLTPQSQMRGGRV